MSILKGSFPVNIFPDYTFPGVYIQVIELILSVTARGDTLVQQTQNDIYANLNLYGQIAAGVQLINRMTNRFLIAGKLNSSVQSEGSTWLSLDVDARLSVLSKLINDITNTMQGQGRADLWLAARIIVAIYLNGEGQGEAQTRLYHNVINSFVSDGNLTSEVSGVEGLAYAAFTSGLSLSALLEAWLQTWANANSDLTLDARLSPFQRIVVGSRSNGSSIVNALLLHNVVTCLIANGHGDVDVIPGKNLIRARLTPALNLEAQLACIITAFAGLKATMAAFGLMDIRQDIVAWLEIVGHGFATEAPIVEDEPRVHPSERTLIVEYDDRTLTIAQDNRTLVIAADNRTLTIAADDRTLVIEQDDRTLVIPAPSRALEVPLEE